MLSGWTNHARPGRIRSRAFLATIPNRGAREPYASRSISLSAGWISILSTVRFFIGRFAILRRYHLRIPSAVASVPDANIVARRDARRSSRILVFGDRPTRAVPRYVLTKRVSRYSDIFHITSDGTTRMIISCLVLRFLLATAAQ